MPRPGILLRLKHLCSAEACLSLTAGARGRSPWCPPWEGRRYRFGFGAGRCLTAGRSHWSRRSPSPLLAGLVEPLGSAGPELALLSAGPGCPYTSCVWPGSCSFATAAEAATALVQVPRRSQHLDLRPVPLRPDRGPFVAWRARWFVPAGDVSAPGCPSAAPKRRFRIHWGRCAGHATGAVAGSAPPGPKPVCGAVCDRLSRDLGERSRCRSRAEAPRLRRLQSPLPWAACQTPSPASVAPKRIFRRSRGPLAGLGTWAAFAGLSDARAEARSSSSSATAAQSSGDEAASSPSALHRERCLAVGPASACRSCDLASPFPASFARRSVLPLPGVACVPSDDVSDASPRAGLAPKCAAFFEARRPFACRSMFLVSVASSSDRV